MHGSSSCNTNIKYNPGYINIAKIKELYSNKTNLARSVTNVKTHVDASPVSNAYAMPFLPSDADERVYRHCQTPIKNNQQCSAVKIFAALTAVTLLAAGGGYLATGETADRSENRDVLVVDNQPIQNYVKYPSPPKIDNWKYDIVRFGDRKFEETPEGQYGMGLNALEEYKTWTASGPHIMFETLKRIEESIDTDCGRILDGFNQMLKKNQKWLATAEQPKKYWLTKRIENINTAKKDVETLRQEIKIIGKDSFILANAKVEQLSKVIKEFLDKHNPSADSPRVTESLCQNLEHALKHLQALNK